MTSEYSTYVVLKLRVNQWLDTILHFINWFLMTGNIYFESKIIFLSQLVQKLRLNKDFWRPFWICVILGSKMAKPVVASSIFWFTIVWLTKIRWMTNCTIKCLRVSEFLQSGHDYNRRKLAILFSFVNSFILGSYL